MANVIKLRKGLDINLKGKATKDVTLKAAKVGEYALVPEAFAGVTPKVVVREGDHVNAGDALFVNKACPNVKFASPVSGTVSAIERGSAGRCYVSRLRQTQSRPPQTSARRTWT